MDFLKYQHVERFGTTECEFIEQGECFIFPKIDGTNSSVWLGDDNKIHAGSRNRELSISQDNAGFFNTIKEDARYSSLLSKYPKLRLYGEWLVPHSLKTYRDNAWRKLYIFDVVTEDQDGNIKYLSYNEYRPILEEFGIDYIPPIAVVSKPSYEQLVKLLDQNTFLIKDGEGFGEGIVIKRYNYKNKYGRVVWGKIVRSEFKEKHAKAMMHTDKPQEGKSMVEDKIVNEYVTEALCEKVLAKLTEEEDWSCKMIPRLLNTVFYDLVREECWNFVKKYKNPTVNFKTLKYMSDTKVKQVLSRLF